MCHILTRAQSTARQAAAARAPTSLWPRCSTTSIGICTPSWTASASSACQWYRHSHSSSSSASTSVRTGANRPASCSAAQAIGQRDQTTVGASNEWRAALQDDVLIGTGIRRTINAMHKKYVQVFPGLQPAAGRERPTRRPEEAAAARAGASCAPSPCRAARRGARSSSWTGCVCGRCVPVFCQYRVPAVAAVASAPRSASRPCRRRRCASDELQIKR